MIPHLSNLLIHPIKSCAPLPLSAAAVEPRGLAGDRRWMVVDSNGRFVTGRQLPQMTLLRARPRGEALELEAPGFPALSVATPAASAPRRTVTIWKDTVEAACADPVADQWLSAVLGQAVHLVTMDGRARRAVDLVYARAGDEVSFADGFPVLLIGQASLDALNARLSRPVPMARFRPNFVVAGGSAHAEDDWRRIRIGGIEFELVKPCTRCVFTTVDPASGRFDPDREPLRTLASYRRSAAGITFGVNVIARGTGIVRIGDAVEVLETAPG